MTGRIISDVNLIKLSFGLKSRCHFNRRARAQTYRVRAESMKLDFTAAISDR